MSRLHLQLTVANGCVVNDVHHVVPTSDATVYNDADDDDDVSGADSGSIHSATRMRGTARWLECSSPSYSGSRDSNKDSGTGTDCALRRHAGGADGGGGGSGSTLTPSSYRSPTSQCSYLISSSSTPRRPSSDGQLRHGVCARHHHQHHHRQPGSSSGSSSSDRLSRSTTSTPPPQGDTRSFRVASSSVPCCAYSSHAADDDAASQQHEHRHHHQRAHCSQHDVTATRDKAAAACARCGATVLCSQCDVSSKDGRRWRRDVTATTSC